VTVEDIEATVARMARIPPKSVSTEDKKKAWQIDGLKKVEQLKFLDASRTLGQTAIQFILAEPSMASVLPNIYNEAFLKEFAAAPSTPSITPEKLSRIQSLYAENFGVAQPVAAV
jgi:aryl-alcohol dehydrogenase-like predicted oxidoreductase